MYVRTGVELEPHPLANLFPAMTETEFEALKEDVRINGQGDPIILHEEKILDGRNRLRACRELGIEPRFEDWDGRGTPLAFVVTKNLHRRHLTESQRALLAARLQGEFEAAAKANMSRGGQGLAGLPTLHARDRAAGIARVSSRLTGSAAVVLERGSPALVAAVERGEVKVSAAEKVAGLNRKEQCRLVSEGPGAVRARAAELRRKDREGANPANGRAGGTTSGDARSAEGNAAAATVGAGPDAAGSGPAENDATDDEWLAGFPLRSKLKDTRVFDQQALFHRHSRAALDSVRRARPEFDDDAGARLSDFFREDHLPADVANAAAPPADWELCQGCRGRNAVRRRGACDQCRGDGFTIPGSGA